MHRFIAVVLTMGVLAASSSRATDYFVSTTGNDNNNGTASTTPFRNLNRAASFVNPGDTVTVAAGTYNEQVTILRAGAAGSPIVFRSATRGAARIIGAINVRTSYVELEGFDVMNPNLHGINLLGHHLTIRNNDVHDSSGNGIYAFASDYLVIEGNRLFRNGVENSLQSSGISVFQPAAVDNAPGFHIIIRRNESWNNESRVNTRANTFNFSNGILLDDFRGVQSGSGGAAYQPATLVENNLIYNNVGRAIVVSGTDNVLIRHNTAWGNLRVRNTTATAATNGTFTCQDASGVRWVNNIVVTRVAADLAVFETRTSNCTWNNNVISTGGITLASGAGAGLGGQNYFTDPLLVDPANGNFRLARGSVAVDAGDPAQAASVDYEGVARPIGRGPDIGAFEQAPDTSVPSGPPVFTRAVPSQTLLAGSFTTFVAYATGASPLRFQWTKDGAAIPGATNATLTFAPLAPTDGGNYAVVVTNGAGSVTSSAASLNVASVPSFVWRNPTPQGGSLNGVAYGGGKFVAVGVNGRVLVSTDGITWVLAATLPTTALNGVAFDAFQWVAVGNNGALFTSRDGFNWTQRNASTTNTLRAVATVNNAWVVSGDGGAIVTSFDGVNWSFRTTGVTQNLLAVAGTTGRYVAAGQAGQLLTSPDTITWTRVTPAGVTTDFFAAAFVNSRFVVSGAAGLIYTSADGINWSVRTSPANASAIRAFAHNGAQYVFVTDGDRVVITPDLASYTNITMPAYNTTTPRLSVAHGGGVFVTVGNGGEISSSPDGVSWTSRGMVGARWINYSVAYGNSQWLVAGSNGGLFTSADGVNWKRQTSPTNNWLRGATYGNNLYLAVGDGGWVVSSTDGITWTGQAASGTTQGLLAVAAANDRYVAVGNNGTIVTSGNGVTWSAANSGVTTTLQNVGVFRGRFYVVGANGVILTSSDGSSWTAANSGSTATLLGLGTDGNTLYVVGTGRTILATTDGQTWSPRSAPAINNQNYRGITKSNRGWLIVGDGGVALFSLDGVTWDFLPVLAEAEQLTAVGSNGVSTVAVGNGGTILQAPDPALHPSAGLPNFARRISNQLVVAGNAIALAAEVTGLPPFSYQWNRNGVPIAGATNPALSFAPAQARDSGSYSVTVTNSAGASTSNNATLSVTPLPAFSWRNPTPEGGALNGVAFSNGRYVAVGVGGRVLTSQDAANWSVAAMLPVNLQAVAFDGAQWIAAGGGGGVFTSVDLINWAQRPASTTVTLRSVAVAGGVIVAGDSGTVITSPDGMNWTARPTGATQTLNGVAATSGRYVAAGAGGTLMTSPDTVTWTRVNLTTTAGAAVTNDLFGVVYVNEQFVAFGNGGVIFSSSDGVSWTQRNITTNTNAIRSMAHDGSQYLFIADNDRAVLSANLTAYTNVTLPAYNLSVPRWSVIHAGGQFVTVGSGGEISTSPNGTTWTQRGSSGARSVNYNVAYLNNRFMAVGNNGGVFTSPDGVAWTRQTTPNTTWMHGCAYGAGRYVVVGDSGWIISSADSVTWSGTQAASTTTQNLTAVAFTNGRFVAVGNNGTIVTSTNGTTWTAGTSGVTSVLQNVGTFGDRFYAVGNNGVLLVSTDGGTWTSINTGTTQTLFGVGGDESSVFVVGGGRTILQSVDGQSFVPRVAPPINNANYRGIAKANGGWLIVGDSGTALFSLDGANWNFLPTLAYAETLFAVASNGTSVVATGNGGTILQAFNAAYGQSRLVNVATRGFVPAGGTLTPGFVLRGSGSKNVLVRAVGPTLASFGLNAISDLRFDLINQSTGRAMASNDDWGGSSALASGFAAVGAFALPATSKDAAVQSALPVNQGGYSVQITAANGASGVALAEVYDADDDDSSVRLVNVSTLGFVGTGENVLTPGFVIRGDGAKLVLIRAVGPGLGALGVSGFVSDPQLSVFANGSNTPIATNNDWGGAASLKAAFTEVAAFSLPDDSRDAAVLTTLPAGAYTVVVSGVANATGVALVEIYDLDP